MKNKFTFHHVSIKTENRDGTTRPGFDSHSTMYLLKRYSSISRRIRYRNSHSTMYLLKR